MFKPHKSRRIRYIVPPLEDGPGHRRGVGGLAFDPHHNITYTGGRDGIIAAWDASWTAPDAPSAPQAADFPLIKQIQAHSDWINGLSIVNGGNAIVTASKDSSVKLWRPHDPLGSQPITFGTHLDSANRLGSPGDTASWIASGGIDRNVVVWDLGSGQESVRFKVHEDNAPSRMVWAMAAAPGMVATGGNDKIVRLFDPRSADRIRELVGHTDIVRDILISRDQELVMSCSSDKSIKLWSLTAGRCISTLSLHDASVWALFSDHPALSCFYSGDRSGTIIKTDCRGFSGGGIEQAVSYALIKESSGIHAIHAANGRVWTATQGHDVNAWKDLDVIPGDIAVETRAAAKGSTGARNRGVSSVSISVSGPSGETTNIPSNCVVRMGNLQGAMSSGGRNRSRMSTHHSVTTRKSAGGPDADLRHPTALRSTPERAVRGRVGLMKAVLLNDKRRVVASDTKDQVHLWDILECRHLKCLGSHPLEKTASIMNTMDVLPNWCSVATDTGALVCTIDEMRALDAEIYADQLGNARDRGLLSDNRINLGAWMLRYLFNDFVLEERERDASFREQLQSGGGVNLGLSTGPMSIELPYATTDAPSQTSRTPKPPKPSLHTPGVFVIGTATPFMPNNAAASANKGDSEQLDQSTDGTLDGSTNKTTPQAGDYFSAKAAEEGTDTASNASQADGSEASRDSSGKEPSSATLSQRFKTAFSTKKTKGSGQSSSPAKGLQSDEKSEGTERTDESSDAGNANEEKMLMHVLQEIKDEYMTAAAKQASLSDSLLKPTLPEEILTLNISPSTRVIIQEQDHCTEKSLAVSDLYQGRQSETGRSTAIIEQVAPYWLGALLFKNERPPKEHVKVPFLLKAFDDSLPQVTHNDGNERLTANRIIRLRKAIDYILDRLEPIEDTDESRSLRPDECLELWCQDKPVDLNYTLAQLKTHVWKSGGDILLKYKATGRRKYHPTRLRDLAGP